MTPLRLSSNARKGTNKNEDLYEFNAPDLVILWGDKNSELYEYSNRQWSGLAKGFINRVGSNSMPVFKVVSKNIGPENQIITDKPASPQASESVSEEISVTLYPVPVGDEPFVLLTNDNKEVTVCIKNIQELPVYTHRYGARQLNGSGINTSGLRPGVYMVQVSGSNGFLKILRFIKL